ncbi:SRPBCC family protein [Flavitalea flava]
MSTKDQTTLFQQTGKKVVVKRSFDAPCELVWSAWTTPELIAKWFSARKEVKMKVLEMEVRTGGHFRFVFSNQDGSILPGEYTGTYILVNPPTKISFQVIDFSRTNDPGGIAALFEVVLTGMGKQTQLVLTATLPDESYIEVTTVGWNACFDNLSEVLI